MPSRRDPWKQCADLLRRGVRRNPRSSYLSDFEIDDAYAASVKHVLNGLPFAASLALEEYLRETGYRYQVRIFGGGAEEIATVAYDEHSSKQLLAAMLKSGWKNEYGIYRHPLRRRR